MADPRKAWNWLAIPPAHHADSDWRDTTIAKRAQELAQADPGFIAISDERRDLTRREWLDEARALAAALQDRGYAAGDVIAFQLPNWHETAVIDLAAALAGLVIVPIVPIYRDAEVGLMLADSGARALFTCAEFRNYDFAAMAARVQQDLPQLEDIFVVRGDDTVGEDYASLVQQGAQLDLKEVEVDPKGVKMVLYTSGTTGRPKGVLHSHTTLDHVLDHSAAHWGVDAGDTLIMPSPVTHISGFANGLEMPLVRGTRTILMERWDAAEAVALIDRHRVSGTVAATPFLVELADAVRKAGTRLPSLRWFACGGAAVPPELIPSARKAFDNLVAFRVFGASEVPLVTYGWPDNPELAATTDGEVVDYQVRIVDDEGRDLPPGEEGEILAHGPAMMLGYSDEKQTRAAIDERGFFRTGDLGRLTADGALTVTGRKKDLIIRGGENISAVEIEDVLRTHPGLQDVSVVAMPHDRLGEGVCAYCIAGDEPPAIGDLVDHVINSGLAKQKIPERFEFVTDFPRTASGKVRKDQLRKDIARKLADA
ncbi:AMP-binding protein [Citromicrobium bathyomarinum]